MYAIYYEFRKDSGAVYQALFIPATTIGSHVIQPTYAYKELTPDRARRVWQVVPNPVYEIVGEEPSSVEDLLEHELTQLVGIGVYMTSPIIDPEWTTVGVFPVEVRDSDLLALKDRNNKMPTDLNARIRSIREQRNFPELPVA